MYLRAAADDQVASAVAVVSRHQPRLSHRRRCSRLPAAPLVQLLREPAVLSLQKFASSLVVDVARHKPNGERLARFHHLQHLFQPHAIPNHRDEIGAPAEAKKGQENGPLDDTKTPISRLTGIAVLAGPFLAIFGAVLSHLAIKHPNAQCCDFGNCHGAMRGYTTQKGCSYRRNGLFSCFNFVMHGNCQVPAATALAWSTQGA